MNFGKINYLVKSILLIYFAISLQFRLFDSPVLAQEKKFHQDHEVFYDFDNDGMATVTQDITLTNLVSEVFVNSFVIILDSHQVENILAFAQDQEIKIETSKSQNETRIKLIFPEKNVGKGNTLSFKVTYQQNGIAQKTGQIWNINLPRSTNLKTIDDYYIYLSIPKGYGDLAQSVPEPIISEKSTESFLFKYDKDQLNDGVSLAFGEVQFFDFILTYHLENPSVNQRRYQVALPPDTGYQRVFLENIEPSPLSVIVDQDGNWLAEFILGSKENLNINASGYTKIYSQPIFSETTKPGVNFQNNLSGYLLEKRYWPVNDENIKNIASELKNPENIYQFVVTRLNYNYDLVGQNSPRQGALGALKRPDQAICTEFTDLFITLARAAGIPAREINGFAYTTNPKLRPLSLVSDILHAWPEYYDQEKNRWIAVDPTWEKTSGINYFDKLDMNHITFAIHGLDSQKPMPAGTYKAQTMNKDVQVVFGQIRSEKKLGLDILFEANEKIYRELKKIGLLVIQNPGPGAAYDQKVEITLSSQADHLVKNIPVIPPYGEVKIPIEYQSIAFSPQKETIIAKINDKEYIQQIPIESWIIQKMLPLAAILGLFFFTIIMLKNIAFQNRKD